MQKLCSVVSKLALEASDADGAGITPAAVLACLSILMDGIIVAPEAIYPGTHRAPRDSDQLRPLMTSVLGPYRRRRHIRRLRTSNFRLRWAASKPDERTCRRAGNVRRPRARSLAGLMPSSADGISSVVAG
jgi:hypothetical protein